MQPTVIVAFKTSYNYLSMLHLVTYSEIDQLYVDEANI